MTATEPQAIDEMMGILNTAWLADANTLALPLLWEDVHSKPPSGSDANGQALPWGKGFIRHAAGGTVSLTGETGKRRYRRTGTIVVQIFSPAEEGRARNRLIAPVARDAYEAAQTTVLGIEYRNAHIEDLGEDGTWYQSNVLVDFEYDEVK